MVADKEFYYSTYHGKLSEADVEGCLARAEYMLHSLTLDRLQDGAWQQDDAQTGSFERRCLRIAAQYIPIRSGLLYRGVSGC